MQTCLHKLLFSDNIVENDFKGTEFFLYNVTRMKQEVTEVSLLDTSTGDTDNKIHVKVMMILNDRHCS